MAQSGYPFDKFTVDNMDLAYIGGLLKLDLVVDEQARMEAMTSLANKRKPSPNRKR